MIINILIVSSHEIHEFFAYEYFYSYEDNAYPLIDATSNWWGGGASSFVAGRIWERRDSDYLIGVNYNNFHATNATLLQGLHL